MNDFLDELGRDLGAAAGRIDAGRAPRGRLGPAIALVAAAAVAAIVVLVAVGGGRELERPAPAATATPQSRYARFYTEPVDAVVARIERAVDVPVAAPALPPGTQAQREISAQDGRASLNLLLPDGRVVSVLYGGAGFDGCGPTGTPRAVRIGSARGLLSTRGGQTTVLWPVRPGGREGTYGLYGPLDEAEALAFARSMPTGGAPPERGRGC